MSRLLKQILKQPAPKFYIQVRHSRFKPFIPVLRKSYAPQLYYSFEERMQEKDKTLKDPERYRKINIGFSPTPKSKDTIDKWKHLRSVKQNKKLEKIAKEGSLKINLYAVEKDWISSNKPLHIKILAERYGIFKHLFGDHAFFFPVVHMNIFYEFGEDMMSPVYTGNLLKPKEAVSVPIVEFESKPNELWTLILTNPDGNLFDNDSEMIHWMVANIPGGDVKEGEQLIDYMRPIPPKGTGFHRFCFVLYKQNQKLDMSQYRRPAPCLNLSQRTFKTFDFYKQFEDTLTPAGLSWFQADYDSSLVDFFHKELGMEHPCYMYEFPKPYIAPQKLFPHNRPFNRYMDLHRDPKETQKLMLLKRLSRVHPFEGEKPLLPYPQAVPVNPNLPIWLKNEIRKERDGKAKYRDMYRGDKRPFIKEGKLRFFPFTKLT